MTGDDKLRPRGREQYPSPGDVAAWTEIAADPHASPGDLMRCLAHDMPESVRFAAVSNPSHDGVAARMAFGDPSPVVRAAVMLSPWIGEEARTALMGDPDVMDAAARMTGDEEGLQARGAGQPRNRATGLRRSSLAHQADFRIPGQRAPFRMRPPF